MLTYNKAGPIQVSRSVSIMFVVVVVWRKWRIYMLQTNIKRIRLVLCELYVGRRSNRTLMCVCDGRNGWTRFLVWLYVSGRGLLAHIIRDVIFYVAEQLLYIYLWLNGFNGCFAPRLLSLRFYVFGYRRFGSLLGGDLPFWGCQAIYWMCESRL